MRHILRNGHRSILEQFAWSHVLLAFDFDGTLAPIVREPANAWMRSRTTRLLTSVARAYPSVVISGRSRADVARRLRGVGLLEVVGNHGAESSTDAAATPANRHFEDVVRRWTRVLRAKLDALQGVVVEDKRYSIAIHYRKSRQRTHARISAERAVAGLGRRVRLLGGKLAINIMPEGAPHKGMALQRLRSKHGADTAIYVGDDATDEDVFSLDEPGRLLSIRVGRTRR